MAAMTSGVWAFFIKPKPPRPAVSEFTRKRLEGITAEAGEPSPELRADFRRYMEIKRRRAA